MKARALEGRRRMRLGPEASVYALARDASGQLVSLGSTMAAHETDLGDGRVEVRVTETGDLTETALQRTVALAFAAWPGDDSCIYSVLSAEAPDAPDLREWVFTTSPTASVYAPVTEGAFTYTFPFTLGGAASGSTFPYTFPLEVA